MNVYSAIDTATNAIVELIESSMTRVTAEQVGLDRRCGSMYINDDCIIVEGDGRSIEYYGGFEYIHSGSKEIVGNYRIYMADDDRVQEAIDCYNESLEEATEEE